LQNYLKALEGLQIGSTKCDIEIATSNGIEKDKLVHQMDTTQNINQDASSFIISFYHL
jgi:hypothetical protein